MKDMFSAAVSLGLLALLIATLWNASGFVRQFGGTYKTFTQSVQPPIGLPQSVALDVPEADLWKSTNPTLEGPSPYKGAITIDLWDSTATADDAAEEYISLRASGLNKEAVRVSGWSLESLVSHTRLTLPTGTLLFRLGDGVEDEKRTTTNGHKPIYLAPGEYLYAVTGSSPVGTSFHTNSCIGQLANYHPFYPRLPETCPVADDILPPTIENITAMGERCVEYIASLQACVLPEEKDLPADLLPACKAHILSRISYNQCVDTAYAKQKLKIYNGGGWYTYLNQPREAWRNKYDVIRLLDAEGRVVDVYSY